MRKSRVLVVDDHPQILLLVEHLLNSDQYILQKSQSAKEALALISKDTPDIIISDIMMPEMNGIDFLKEVKKMPHSREIPFILLTALSDSEDVVRGLEAGAEDYIAKPFDGREFVARVKNMLRLREYQEEMRKNYELLLDTMKVDDKSKNLLEKDLERAKNLQRHLLPQKKITTPHFRMEGIYRPVIQVGGDYYDIKRVGSGQYLFLLADIMGHGVASAIVMGMVKSIISVYLQPQRSPRQMILLTSHIINKILKLDYLVAVFYGIYNAHKKILTYVNAGQCPPILWRGRMKSHEYLSSESSFLGVLDEDSYREHEVRIQRDDLLILYTDGLTDLVNSRGDRFLRQGILKTIQEKPKAALTQRVKLLNQSIKNFSGAIPPRDDITLMMMEFKK